MNRSGSHGMVIQKGLLLILSVLVALVVFALTWSIDLGVATFTP